MLRISVFRSVLHPRIHDQLMYHSAALTGYDSCPLQPYVDGGGVVVKTSARTREALERRGHELIGLDYLGTCQAVAVDREIDQLTAVSDMWKGGCSVGY